MLNLNDRHRLVLINIGYPGFDFEAADDESFSRVYEAIEDEMLDRGRTEDHLNDYGELCSDILFMVADL